MISDVRRTIDDDRQACQQIIFERRDEAIGRVIGRYTETTDEYWTQVSAKLNTKHHFVKGIQI